MNIKSSKQIYEEHLEKGTPTEHILKVMVGRADRYQDYYDKSKERYEALKEEHYNLLRSSGRLVKVKVNHVARDNWGYYTWYKNNKYRYECDGIWKKCKDQSSPHYNARHTHASFNVNILLADEDMPEVFIGKCSGSVLGKKVILADGHMIGYGDEFELRKKK